MKSSGQTCTRPARYQEMRFCLAPVQRFRNAFAGHRSKLYRRTFPAKRQSAQHAQEASCKLCYDDTPPLVFQHACHLALDLRDPAACYHRIEPDERRHYARHERQSCEPYRHTQRILRRESHYRFHPLSRKLQRHSVEQHHEACEKSYKDTFSDQYYFESVCTFYRLCYVFSHVFLRFLISVYIISFMFSTSIKCDISASNEHIRTRSYVIYCNHYFRSPGVFAAQSEHIASA